MLPTVRTGLDSRCFSPRTASTASPLTSSVLAQDSGGCSDDEKTVLGMAVMAASPGSSGMAAA